MPNDTEQPSNSTQTGSITDFLLARIAEDEALARALLAEHPMWDWESYMSGAGGYDGHAAMFAAHNNPARVLAECEAKRRIVALHPILSWTEPGRSLVRDKPMCASCADNENADYDGAPLVDWPCPTLRLLALPHADHPDYREAWA